MSVNSACILRLVPNILKLQTGTRFFFINRQFITQKCRLLHVRSLWAQTSWRPKLCWRQTPTVTLVTSGLDLFFIWCSRRSCKACVSSLEWAIGIHYRVLEDITNVLPHHTSGNRYPRLGDTWICRRHVHSGFPGRCAGFPTATRPERHIIGSGNWARFWETCKGQRHIQGSEWPYLGQDMHAALRNIHEQRKVIWRVCGKTFEGVD